MPGGSRQKPEVVLNKRMNQHNIQHARLHPVSSTDSESGPQQSSPSEPGGEEEVQELPRPPPSIQSGAEHLDRVGLSTEEQIEGEVVDDKHLEDNRAAARASTLVSQRHLRKAAHALASTTPILNPNVPEVLMKLKSQHPECLSSLPPLPNQPTLHPLPSMKVVRRILTSSDNGASGGPSGWCGNMLSVLAEDDICVKALTILIGNIINGNIPDTVAPHLLSCRLIALSKENDGVRPIAIGELLYRVAAAHVARSISDIAALQLQPIQYAVGVPNGCERIIHAISHSLTNKDKPLACLSVDFANAFNTIDRGLLLSKLYACPDLEETFRIVHLAYSKPSALNLGKGCKSPLQSSNGVRQGDPLSTLLFSLAVQDTYESVARSADITPYAFVDDLQIVGTPS